MHFNRHAIPTGKIRHIEYSCCTNRMYKIFDFPAKNSRKKTNRIGRSRGERLFERRARSIQNIPAPNASGRLFLRPAPANIEMTPPHGIVLTLGSRVLAQFQCRRRVRYNTHVSTGDLFVSVILFLPYTQRHRRRPFRIRCERVRLRGIRPDTKRLGSARTAAAREQKNSLAARKERRNGRRERQTAIIYNISLLLLLFERSRHAAKGLTRRGYRGAIGIRSSSLARIGRVRLHGRHRSAGAESAACRCKTRSVKFVRAPTRTETAAAAARSKINHRNINYYKRALGGSKASVFFLRLRTVWCTAHKSRGRNPDVFYFRLYRD